MAYAQTQGQSHSQNKEQFVHSPRKFKTFDKYDFIKSLVAASVENVEDFKQKEREEKRAEIIAEAFEENQNIIFENLATKDELKLEIAGVMKEIKVLEAGMMAMETELKKDMKTLEKEIKSEMKQLRSNLIITLTGIMAALFTFLPLATEFIRHLFKL